jgi:hypothetical protein
MTDDDTLRDSVLEAIRAGKLPDCSPKRTWGGPGAGACCPVCGERVKPDEMEFELEFAAHPDGRQREIHHLHSGCFSVWERERRKLDLKRDATMATELPSAGGEARVAVHGGEAPHRWRPS